jgi:hypothetical protein
MVAAAKSPDLRVENFTRQVQAELQAKENVRRQSKSKSFETAMTVLLYGDEATFSPSLLGREVRFLENSFGRPVLAYSISSAKDLVDVLQTLTKTQTLVQNLVVHGLHGGTFGLVPFFEVQDRRHEDFANVDFDQLQSAGIHLNFAANAFVFFDSCNLIEKETLQSIRTSTGQLKKIGFATGWVYMNHEEGLYAVENTFGVPFYKESTVSGGLRKLAAQSIWYITLPYFAYLDRFKYNHGFLVAETGAHELILRTHAFDVEGGVTGGEFFAFH